MAFEAKLGRDRLDRLVLEQHPEGVYIFVFETPNSKYPERDYLQDDLNMAMEVCAEDYGVGKTSWIEMPNPGLK